MLPVPERLAPETVPGLRREVLRHRSGETVVLDCRRLGPLDSLGAARLLRVIAEARGRGIEVRLANLEEGARRLLAEVDPAILDEDRRPPRRHPLEALGEVTVDAAAAARAVGGLARDTALGLTVPFGRHGIKWDRALQQMALVGSSAV